MELLKIDVIVDKIIALTNEEGYFSPHELRSAFSLQRDLQKVAGLTINQLEKHSFSKEGMLRVPSHLGIESVKGFINIAKTAQLQGRKLSFAEAQEIVEKIYALKGAETSDLKVADSAPVEVRKGKVILRKGAVASSKPKEEPEPTIPEVSESGQKIDRLVGVIIDVSDPEGRFDPTDVYAKVRGTGLSKSLSVIVSNLKLQGFVNEDKLRIPVSGGSKAVKDFINLAARLRRQNARMSFDDAVAGRPSEASPAEPTPPPEASPAPLAAQEPLKPSEAKPEPIVRPEEPIAVSKPEEDFKALYQEMKAKVSGLEGELSAYKDMCFHFIEIFRR